MMQQARVIGQAFNKWIVVQAGADVVLVDQVTPHPE
jgi:DNA mismatch repair ATPase MutL